MPDFSPESVRKKLEDMGSHTYSLNDFNSSGHITRDTFINPEGSLKVHVHVWDGNIEEARRIFEELLTIFARERDNNA